MVRILSIGLVSTLAKHTRVHSEPAKRQFFSLLRSLSILGVLAGASHAAAINWELKSVIFADGAIGTGTFVYDAPTQHFLTWSITTSASSIMDDYTYTPDTSLAIANYGGCTVNFIASANPSRFLCLNPESALVLDATPQLLASSLESSPGGIRGVLSGSLSDPPPGGGVAIPEPATVLLALAAFIAVAARRLALVRAI